LKLFTLYDYVYEKNVSFFFLFLLNTISRIEFRWFENSTERFTDSGKLNGGSVLGGSQFSILPPAASKNTARFKSGQN